jgi:hypothetical protein
MESSPVNENHQMEVDLCTPSENLKKHSQEITPDNPTQPEKRPLLATKKVSGVRISQKFSKRKLFGQTVDQTSGKLPAHSSHPPVPTPLSTAMSATDVNLINSRK